MKVMVRKKFLSNILSNMVFETYDSQPGNLTRANKFAFYNFSSIFKKKLLFVQ